MEVFIVGIIAIIILIAIYIKEIGLILLIASGVLVLSNILAWLIKNHWFLPNKSQSSSNVKEKKLAKKNNQREKREQKRLDRVYKLSKLGQALKKINDAVIFESVVYDMYANCETGRDFDCFSEEEYFKQHYATILSIVDELKNNIEKNKTLYREYQESFFSCREFSSREEIKQISKRGMSIKKFQFLEQQLHYAKMKPCPKQEFSIRITIRCRKDSLKGEKSIIVGQEKIASLLKRIQEAKDLAFVKKHSKVFQRANELNARFTFYSIYSKEYHIDCISYSEYQKITAVKCIKERLERNYSDELKTLYEHALANEKAYDEYIGQYRLLQECMLSENEVNSIEGNSIDFKTFRKIEMMLYSKQMRQKPYTAFFIRYEFEYKSPAGRNHYRKEENVSHTTIGDLLLEIEKNRAEKWRRAQEEAEMRD